MQEHDHDDDVHFQHLVEHVNKVTLPCSPVKNPSLYLQNQTRSIQRPLGHHCLRVEAIFVMYFNMKNNLAPFCFQAAESKSAGKVKDEFQCCHLFMESMS